MSFEDAAHTGGRYGSVLVILSFSLDMSAANDLIRSSGRSTPFPDWVLSHL